jgi:hypothetical protein
MLLRFQAMARLRMCLRRVRTPRRLVLTVLALVLAAVWIGQAVAGILFRASADPDRLRVWVPIGLLSYGLWHVLKTVCRQPIEPFEWTPTEYELLSAAPLPRQQVVGYRLTSVVASAVVKALLFALVMLPDLPIWPLGFAGMLLALVFLDLLRMTLEVFAWGSDRRTFVWTRSCVIVLAMGCVLSALILAKCQPTNANMPTPVLGLVFSFVMSFISLNTTLPGLLAQAPFRSFANLILASGAPVDLLFQLGVAVATVVGAAWALIRLDSYYLWQRAQAEAARFGSLVDRRQDKSTAGAPVHGREVRVPWSLRGCGAIIWRQSLGMLHYGPSVLFAMLLPGFMALLPLFTDVPPLDAAVQVTGGLVFYSFLLMPSALRFDFRRDVDRIAVLKTLPVTPFALTLGQLAVPVLACTLFQATVLIVAMIAQPYDLHILLFCILLLIPVNAVIFGLENLIFMLFPYRPNQEGVSVFIRSILTFTAKGLLFFVALVVMVVWLKTAAWIVGQTTVAAPGPMILAVTWTGISLLMCALAVVLAIMLSRVYRGFDPSQDTPPMS